MDIDTHECHVWLHLAISVFEISTRSDIHYRLNVNFYYSPIIDFYYLLRDLIDPSRNSPKIFIPWTTALAKEMSQKRTAENLSFYMRNSFVETIGGILFPLMKE